MEFDCLCADETSRVSKVDTGNGCLDLARENESWLRPGQSPFSYLHKLRAWYISCADKSAVRRWGSFGSCCVYYYSSVAVVIYVQIGRRLYHGRRIRGFIITTGLYAQQLKPIILPIIPYYNMVLLSTFLINKKKKRTNPPENKTIMP